MKHIVSFLLVLLLFGCTKEYSCENCMDGLLVKSVTRMNTDSFVYAYRYDARYRLTIEDFDSRWGAAVKKTETVLERANDHINKVIYKGSDLTALGLDSISYNIGYNGSRYTYKAGVYSIFSTMHADSTVYTYSSFGRIGAEERFVNNEPVSKTVYTYTPEGNLSGIKVHKFNSGSYVVISEEVYTYDNHPAPLILGHDAVIAGKTYLLSPNNPIAYTYTSSGNTYSTTTNYSYNDRGKPATATANYTNTNVYFTTSYHYSNDL